MEKTNNLEMALQGLDAISDFQDDTRALLIKRFNTLKEIVAKDLSLNPNEVRELEKLFGDFLISIGKDYRNH